jgi:type IV pilus assembly protein PilE
MDVQKMCRRSSGGFTLIELMIVIVVVAVLMGIALPAYRDQVIRGHRAAAKGEILEIASREKQFLLANRAYVNETTLETNGFSLADKVADNYIYTIELGTATLPSYTITFTPKAGSSQADDGALSFTSEGVRSPADKWER